MFWFVLMYVFSTLIDWLGFGRLSEQEKDPTLVGGMEQTASRASPTYSITIWFDHICLFKGTFVDRGSIDTRHRPWLLVSPGGAGR